MMKILFLIISGCLVAPAIASTPNVVVTVAGVDTEWEAKRGVFGSTDDELSGELVLAPEYDSLLCEYSNETREVPLEPIDPLPSSNTIMLAARGVCTFESKALAAKRLYGAKGVLIYDNLSARYRFDKKKNEVTFPREQWDYECENGYGVVYNLDLDPPAYNGDVLDQILDMNSPVTNCSLALTRTPCESNLCLVTSHSPNSTRYPVCCAWDLPVTMANSKSVGDTDDIMAVFLTIRQGQAILQHLGSQVTITAKQRRTFNGSMIFLWMLGTLVTYIGCWYSAQEYVAFRKKLAAFQEKQNLGQDEEGGEAGRSGELNDFLGTEDTGRREDMSSDADLSASDFKDERDDTQDDEKKDKKKKKWTLRSLPKAGAETKPGEEKPEDVVFVLRSLPPPERRKKKKKGKKKKEDDPENNAISAAVPTAGLEDDSDSDGEEVPDNRWSSQKTSYEMTQWHVMSFLVFASVMLFLLFFFQFYDFVVVMYGIGCAGSVSYLIFGPLLVHFVPKLGDAVVEELNKPVLCGLNGFDVTSQLIGYIWAAIWLWYGLSHYRPSTNAFFWITMNVFGACFCILALNMLKITNIKIATMLMVAIFFYDIFFVFITPLFFDGQSIMLTVAKGGGSDTIADDFCFKYPEERECKGIDFLPMLLIIPRFNDYTRGSSLLGLGDIVLPGFLISFGLRVDEALRLLGRHTSLEVAYPDKWYEGYFFPLMVSYGVGLFLAFLALSISGVGQPALLYLVPCCLGTMFFLGRKEIKELWEGPNCLKLADKLKRRSEKVWSRAKLKRLVAKKKRQRAAADNNDDGDDNDDNNEPKSNERDPLNKKNSARGRKSNGDDNNNNNNTRAAPPMQRGTSQRARGDGMKGARDNSKLKKQPSARPGGGGPPPPAGEGKGPRKAGGPANKRKKKPDNDQNASAEEGTDGTGNKKGGDNNNNNNNNSSNPRPRDVCFGKEAHPGTKDFRRVVKETADKFKGEKYGPPIYKEMRTQLKGKKFYKLSQPKNGNWIEVERNEIIDRLRHAYVKLTKK